MFKQSSSQEPQG